MRTLVVSGVLLAARLAQACPACAGAQPTVRPLHLALVVLPLVVGAVAVRAVIRAMRD